jgi:hypothetical protein
MIGQGASGVRKVWQVVEEVRAEGSHAVDPPTRIAATVVVVRNPLAGRWVDDLQPLIDAYSAELGELLATRTAHLLGVPAEAFGKGVIVGLDSEVEHGSAVIHNLRFGNPIRHAAGDAATLLPGVEKRGAAGTAMDIPLKHVQDATIRSHHQSFEVRVPDAPFPDELMIAVAMASGGRPLARLKDSAHDFEGLA